MIHLSSDTKLAILLPNQNKALAEAIKNATPEQLEQLSGGKDLRSILGSVFSDKLSGSKSDQVLLDILKNSSAFKQLGDFADEFKALTTALKTDSNLAAKFSSLETFLKSPLALDASVLKGQVANSGIFMESKIALALQPMESIREALGELEALLSKSSLPEVRPLSREIKVLLNTPLLKNGPEDVASAREIITPLKSIASAIERILSKTDPLFGKEIASLTQAIDQLGTYESLKLPPPTLQEIKSILIQLYNALLPSSRSETNPLLSAIESLLSQLKTLPPDRLPSDEIKTLSHQLQSAIAKGDIVASKEVSSALTLLTSFTKPEHLVPKLLLQESMRDDVKSQLLQLQEELYTSSHPKSEELQKHVDKLLTTIDYHQLLSHLGSSNSIYLPFVWDQLEEGSLSFKKNGKKKFYCEINLKLKEYGELNLMMALYDENQLEIQAHTEKTDLKKLLQEHLPQLRSLLIDAGLTPRRIRIFEMKESHLPALGAYGDDPSGSDFGFEAKV